MLFAIHKESFCRRNLSLTNLSTLGASRMEWTTRRRIDGIRNIALQGHTLTLLLDICNRNSREQCLSVGMQSILKQFLSLGQLNNLA